MLIRNNSMRKVTTLVLLLVLTSATLPLAGCNDSDLDRMAKASREIAGDVVTGEKAVTAAFEGGLISLPKKDEYAGYFHGIASAGTEYNNLVKNFSDQAKNGTLPPTALAILAASFNKVVSPFLKLLDDLGKLSASANTAISLGIVALRAAVVAIAAVMAARGSKTAQRNMKQLGLRGIYV